MSAAWDDAGRFDFRRRLDEGFDSEDIELRAIDRAVARWVLAHGGSMLLARVAAAASRAEGEGDSVLVLAGEGSGRFLAPLEEDALVELAREPLVASVEQAGRMAAGDSDSSAATAGWAFVLEGAQFYLRRSFAHEQALAAMLRARRGGTPVSAIGTGAVSSSGGPGPTLWDVEMTACPGNAAGSSGTSTGTAAGAGSGGSGPSLSDIDADAGALENASTRHPSAGGDPAVSQLSQDTLGPRLRGGDEGTGASAPDLEGLPAPHGSQRSVEEVRDRHPRAGGDPAASRLRQDTLGPRLRGGDGGTGASAPDLEGLPAPRCSQRSVEEVRDRHPRAGGDPAVSRLRQDTLGPRLRGGDDAGGIGVPSLEGWVDQLFGGDRSAAVQAQRAAVAGFVERGLFVLTGGPGTGKTTTVLRMLLLRLRAHRQRFGAFPRLRLAAPTGKAAQRLAESLQSGAVALRDAARAAETRPATAPDTDATGANKAASKTPDASASSALDATAAGATGFDAAWAPALDHVLAAEAGTLHRLLGSRGPARGHAWHRERRLPLDLLVIDEASMVDLALLRASFEALPDEAAVLLVGDAEQLASVGTGSVLRDLVEALQSDPRGDLVRLQHSFRAEAALQPLNAAIAEGDIARFGEAASRAGDAFALRAVGDARSLQSALIEHAQRLHAALDAGDVFAALPVDAAAQAQAITRAHAALRDVQLLCALRQGPFGALACDAAIDVALKRRLGLPEGQAWYPGRAVIVLQNDYAAGLFNGDIGLCLRSADGSLRVWFEARGAGGTGLRGLAPGALPLHGGGFALSVHKSQGSEYGEVALLLPPDPEHPILGRALLYTGATRARRALSLWCSEAALHTALSRATQRVSGLAARLLPG